MVPTKWKIRVTSEQPLRPAVNTSAPAKRPIKTVILFFVAILLGVAAFLTWHFSPPQMVTSILLKEKPAMTTSLDGLQLGERLAEGGESDLYLVLEYFNAEEPEQYKSDVIQVATVGNGVTFDIPDDLIQYERLQRITVYDEDLISDDIYDSIDVTLAQPYIGSVYQFQVNFTRPNHSLIVVLLSGAALLSILSVVLYLRQIAR